MSSTAVVGEYYLKDPNDDSRVKVGTYSDTSYDPEPTKAGFFTSDSHRGSMSNGYSNGDSERRDSRPNVPFVSGDGVNQARLNRPAAVKVLPYGMVGDYFTVDAQGPYDSTAKPLDLRKERDGQIIGSYTPDNIGPWTVSVKHEGNHIPNSPFTCEVYDPTQVEVNDLHDDILGKLVKFSVNTAKAGNGDLTVHVNGPDGRRVRSKIEDVGPHNYNVSFSPDTAGNHKIDVEFNNDEVSGSPFNCYIGEPGMIEAEESHSVAGSHHHDHDHDHDHHDHDHHHHDHDDHHHHHDHHDAPATYTVTESRVLEPPKREVIVTAIHGAVVDRPAGFLVDATRAGGGDFDITITNNERPVPYQVVGEREPGVFEVTFLPKEAGTYRIDVFYEGKPVRGSPFYVRIQDSADIEHYIYVPSKTTVYQEVEVEQPRYTVEQPRYSVVEEHRERRPPTPVYRTPTPPPVVYRAPTPPPVVYRAPTPPPVVYRAQTPPPVVYQQAPPQQAVYQQSAPAYQQSAPAVNDRCYAHGEKLHTVFKDRHAEFPIRTEDSMNMKEMDVQILGPTTRALASLEKDADTTANVRFVPTETGRFDTSIKYYGKEAEGNPFSFTVIDPNDITCVYPPVGADRSFSWPVGDPCKVTLDTSKAGSGRLGTKVSDPLGSSVPTNFDQDNAFQFTPRMEGRHPINLDWDGADLAPIYCDAYNSRDRARTPPSPAAAKQSYEVILKGTGLQRAMVDETAEFTIDGTRAGGGDGYSTDGRGTPACSVTGPEGPVDVFLQPLDDQGDMYKARYTPRVPGVHDLDVAWSGRPLEGSPYKVQVEGGARRDASRVELGGLDRDPVLVGEPAYLTADLRDAGQGGILSARCKGPTQKAKVNMKDNGNGTYGLEVIPREEGKHRMDVRYDDQAVKGSPFNFYVVGPVDPSKVRCFGPGLESGNLQGYRGNFVCETKGAGHGKLQVRVHGPKGGFNVRMTPIKDSGNRTIAVEYEPREPGDYHIDVTWDKQHVPGSPFLVRIDDEDEVMYADRNGGDYGYYHSEPITRSRSASQRSSRHVKYPNYGYALPGNYKEKERIYGRRIERDGPVSTYY
ncbi:filamin-C-like isoform X1 [Branchiostoma floridae x Branchiostoma japonicum]